MNWTFTLEKVTFLVVVFSYITTFTFVEAERSIKVIKTKLTSPVHIHLPGGPGNNPYARRYGYGRNGPNYNIQGKNPRNNKYFERRNRKFGPRNYANEFRNWSPNRFHAGKYNPRVDNGKYNPRTDNGKRGPPKPPYPFIREPPFKNPNFKWKPRPQKVSSLQKPQPPKLLINDFDEEYYFPEEAVKAESKYELDIGYSKSKKKRRNPGDLEKIPGRPELKGPYYVGKPAKHSKQKNRNSIGAFGPRPSEEDEDYDEEEALEYTQQTPKSKKKKMKKKSHPKKKNKDNDYESSHQYEQEDMAEAYDNDTTERSSKKRIKKQPYEVKDEEEKQYNNGLTAVNDHYNVPKGIQKPAETANFNPNYQQSWSQIVGTTQRSFPIIINNNPNPQQFVPNQFSNQYHLQNPYNYQNNVQKPQFNQITSSNQQSHFYSQPDTYYNRNVIFSSSANNNNNNNNNFHGNNQMPSEKPQVSTFQNTAYSSNAYSYQQNPNSYVSSNQNFHSHYNSNNNNNNNSVYVKNQSLSYVDNTPKFGSRLPASQQTGNGNIADAESDFLKKHQSLYNKGLSGVPIQGDGYRKDGAKGDYDIGYGDFQFDESTST